jgi:hypothetical protein
MESNGDGLEEENNKVYQARPKITPGFQTRAPGWTEEEK